ncbi:MAG: CobW family GTP-binding protein [Thiobacillaceae bacterium]
MTETTDANIPVILLTGFLGSGKTTLLNRILREWPLTAVVMNEFGETALDHRLVEGVQGPLALLSGGCVCCTVQGALAPTLKNLVLARKDGKVSPFERLIIETTGLADPASVLATLLHDRWLGRFYRMESVVTTVDAQFGEESLAAHPEAQRQVAVADRLVVTKTDLVAPEEVAALQQTLARLNPQAGIVAGRSQAIDIHALLDSGGWRPESRPERVRAWLAVEPERLRAAPVLLRPRAAPAPKAVHTARVQSFSLQFDEPLDWQGLEAALGLLVDFRGRQLLRMKAIVNVAGRAGPVVLHGVQHVFYPPVELSSWPDEDRTSRFVFITEGLDADFVRKLLDDFSQAAKSGLIERAHNVHANELIAQAASDRLPG